MSTADHDYAALIDRLVAARPRNGYHSLLDIPLTEADVFTVASREPDILADAFSVLSPSMQSALLAGLRPQDTMTQQWHCERMIGRNYMAAVTVEARTLVLGDVQTAIAELETNDDDPRTEREIACNEASLPAWGPL